MREMPDMKRINGAVLGQPWLISRDGMALILSVLDGRGDLEAAARTRAARALDHEIDAVMTRPGERLSEQSLAVRRGPVAVLPVRGPIFRYAGLFDDISGATSIARLATSFQEALDAPGIEAVVLAVDSPGGQVAGTNEFADMVYAARNEKRIVAYVNGAAASAAYWIASAASEIVVDPTAELGSIGVVIGTRKADDDVIEIVSTVSPKKRVDPATDEGRAELLQRADAIAAVFVAAVARNRGVDEETVVTDFGRGGILVGEAAIAAGMADRLGNMEGLIAELAAGPGTNDGNGSTRRGTIMSKDDNKNTALAVTIETVAQDHPDIAAHFRAEGAKAERERIAAVMELGDKPADGSLAAKLWEMAMDGETTKEKAALAVLERQKKAAVEAAADLAADAAEIPVVDTAHDGADEAGELKSIVAGIVAGANR